MVLRNAVLRGINMLNLIRNAGFTQSVLSHNVAGILGVRITGLNPGLEVVNFYSTRSKITSEESNLKNSENSSTGSKKKFFSPRITVISNGSTLTVMTLEEAQKLSKRRDLKLVKIVDIDHKTQRPVYKLMTGTEYFQEDLNRRKEKSLKKSEESKDPKLLTLSSNIGGHDLGSKIKNIIKWLNKKHEVRIVINCGNNEEAAELICKTIETETKTCGKLVQKRKKGDDLKFQLVSLRKKESDPSKEKEKEEIEIEEKS